MSVLFKSIGSAWIAIVGICLMGDGFKTPGDIGELTCCAGAITIGVALYLAGSIERARRGTE